MTDSSQTQGNKSPSDKHTPPDPNTTYAPSSEQLTPDNKSEVMTEKFLAVAKEKNHLESIIISQNDIIKGLEKEKAKLTLSLKKLAAGHKSMREKLLDFDILRNMEISELKKKIEQLTTDSKKVISEKDSILRNLERDQRNIFRVDNQVVESLMREKKELEQQLRKTLKESGGEVKQSTQAAGEVDLLNADKANVQEDLQQEAHDYSREIAALKTDIDELTASVESKIHSIDELNAKVGQLREELSHKDSQLRERVPALLEKMNSLSDSIDSKTEANSLFAKELSELNGKLTALNAGMVEKDELLSEIATDYKKKMDEIDALHAAHELTLRNLVHERNLLKQECEDLRSISAFPPEQRNNEQQEKILLEERLSAAVTAMDELRSDNAKLAALLSERDTLIDDLQRDMELMQARVERAAAEHAESLAAAQDQCAALNQQLLEKDEMLSALTAERSHASQQDQAIASLRKELLLYQTQLEEASAGHASQLAALQEKITLLNQQLLEKQELLTVMASEHEHDRNDFVYQTELLRKEKADLDKEMKRLIERDMEQKDNLTSHLALLDVIQKERARFEEDLARASEQINELVLERDRLVALSAYKDQSLSAAGAETSMLRASISALQASQTELEKKIRDKHDISGLTDAEKEDLQKAALEYKETFEHLKHEIIVLNKNLAEKEQAIEQLLREKDGLAGNIADLQEKLGQYLAAMRDLERQLNESRHENNRFSTENRNLSHTIAHLQDEISALTLAGEEKGKALKDDLSSYGRAADDLQLRLEQSLRENAELRADLKAAQSTVREAPTPVIEKKEEPLRMRAQKQQAVNKRFLAYSLLALFLIAGIGVSFYAYNTGLIPLPEKKPAAIKEVKKELTYNDMFSLLTKVSVSDDVKFQATLLTESLVLKSDSPEEKALFDFQNHLYFKVNLSAPTKGLVAEMVNDPYPMITLTAGGDTVKPLSHLRVKGIKTFYRKEEPVSLMFYCAFPKTALTPDRNTLSLSLQNEKDKAVIEWDLNSLRDSNLFP